MSNAISVAIVEDNYFSRMSLSQIIDDKEEFELTGSYDCQHEAIQGIIAKKPSVVLMDIDLGASSGFDVMKKIKLENPKIKFLMCTVHEDVDHILTAFSSGANGYILKQSTSNEIQSAISFAAQGGFPMSNHIASQIVAGVTKNQHVDDPNCEMLSNREQEVLKELIKGKLTKEIADTLNISYETVKKHTQHIYKKLNVNNRMEAYNKCCGSCSKKDCNC